MSHAKFHVADPHDPDFQPPVGKAHGEPPTSRLAIFSLFTSVVGLFVPPFGSLIAIVTGHIALREIRDSRGLLGGRSLATAGLWLGYLWLALIALGFGLAAIVWLSARPAAQATLVFDSGDVSALEPPRWDLHAVPGVKLSNEVTPSYMTWLRENHLLDADEPVVVAHEAPADPVSGVQMTVVTPRRVLHVFRNHVTALSVDDISEVLSGDEYASRFEPVQTPQSGKYTLAILGRDGSAIRLKFDDPNDGATFSTRLQEVLEIPRGQEHESHDHGGKEDSAHAAETHAEVHE